MNSSKNSQYNPTIHLNSQRLFLLTFAVVSAVSADVSHLFHDASVDGYHYEPPHIKLCPDGTAREVCDECPPGTIGVYPNCKPKTTPAPKCPPGKTGIYPNCDNGYLPPEECPPGK